VVWPLDAADESPGVSCPLTRSAIIQRPCTPFTRRTRPSHYLIVIRAKDQAHFYDDEFIRSISHDDFSFFPVVFFARRRSGGRRQNGSIALGLAPKKMLPALNGKMEVWSARVRGQGRAKDDP